MEDADKIIRFLTGHAKGVLCGLLAVFSFRYFLREFWFDECLTFELIQNCRNTLDVYNFYFIPNNHIVFSILLRLWTNLLTALVPMLSLLLLRLLPLGIAFVAILILFRGLRASGGIFAALFVSCAIALSPAFLIYATALRGYGLGFLLTASGCFCARRIVRTGSAKAFLLYFILALAAVGTTPTNLAAFFAIALLFAPDALRKGRRMRVLSLFLFPVLALILFYLPIAEKFLKCARLGEGWNSSFAAAWNFYASALLAFLPVLPFALKQFQWKISLRTIAFAATILIPLAVFFVFPVPPFPRVFLPLFAVWAFPLCLSAGRTFRRFTPGGKALAAGGLFLWCAGISFSAQGISNALFPNHWQDDLIAPYYVLEDFRPAEAVQRMEAIRKTDPSAVFFLTFEADYPSLLFAAMHWDDLEDVLLFDVPNKPKRETLPQGRTVYVISRDASDMEMVRNRFALPPPCEEMHFGLHRVWRFNTR